MSPAKFVLALLFFGLVFGTPAQPAAKKPGSPATAAEEKPAKRRTTYPYHGVLGRVDHAQRVIYLAGKKKERVILLTPKTRILRNGKQAQLADAKPGERVSGSVSKNEEGREVAGTLNLKGGAAD